MLPVGAPLQLLLVKGHLRNLFYGIVALPFLPPLHRSSLARRCISPLAAPFTSRRRPLLSNPFWARTRAASPRLNAMQLAAAALRTSLYKKEAQNDHSIVEASSEYLAQIEIVLSLGESRPCPRECDPACPACPISGCLRSCPPSTTGAEAITFDRPFEHDKKLPVLADVVRTPS